MPIIYRPSQTWPESAGQDELAVLGGELDAVGDESSEASAWVVRLAGPPFDRALPSLSIVVQVRRAMTWT